MEQSQENQLQYASLKIHMQEYKWAEVPSLLAGKIYSNVGNRFSQMWFTFLVKTNRRGVFNLGIMISKAHDHSSTMCMCFAQKTYVRSLGFTTMALDIPIVKREIQCKPAWSTSLNPSDQV